MDFVNIAVKAPPKNLHIIKTFLHKKKPTSFPSGKAISLFSGAGISDTGYALAGFDFIVQVEMSARRAALGQANFHGRERPWIVGDVREKVQEIIQTYRERAGDERPALLVGTPPCQGLSSSNPSRGQRKGNQAKDNEEKNKLLLTLADVAAELRPRVIVVENVRQVLTLHVDHRNRTGRLVEHFKWELRDYEVFEGIVDVADYGISQNRKRAILVAVHRDEPWLPALVAHKLGPWPRRTHKAPELAGDKLNWVTSVEWFDYMKYPSLDSASGQTAKNHAFHPLHEVPSYEKEQDRYLQISSIPKRQGRTAYQNSPCLHCEQEVPDKDKDGRKEAYLSHCPACGGELINRPYVRGVDKAGKPTFRLIKGFTSSYRRMYPDRPCSTVTTNSSHVGSDYKIHPFEDRVLSILEVSDLQTVPRYYNWKFAYANNLRYTIRNVIGEAFPAYFTYLHGKLLADLLNQQQVADEGFTREAKRVEVKTLSSLELVPLTQAPLLLAGD